MLGLGSSITRSGKIGPSIISDGLVLKHGYSAGAVEPVSTGAANLDLDGDDFIDLGDLAAFDFSGDFTLALWIRAEGSSNYNAIMSNYETNKGWWFILNGGKLRMGLENGGGSNPDTDSQGLDLRDGKWHHVAVTCTTSNIILYTDGVLIHEETDTWTPAQTSSAATMIGKRDGIDEFDGYMCNVGAWNAVLTQPQIKSIMHKDYAGLSDSEKTNLVSWWNLDSVIDSADIKDGDTTVYDNHHGGSDTLGSELVTSYEVTESDTTGKWTTYGTSTLTSNNNILTSTIGGGDDDDNEGAKYDITSVAGYTAEKTYKVEADIWLGTYVPNPTNQFKIYLGGVQQAITLSTTQTTFTAYITTSDTTDLMIYQNDADDTEGTFFISNVSIKLVNGNTGTLS